MNELGNSVPAVCYIVIILNYIVRLKRKPFRSIRNYYSMDGYSSEVLIIFSSVGVFFRSKKEKLLSGSGTDK